METLKNRLLGLAKFIGKHPGEISIASVLPEAKPSNIEYFGDGEVVSEYLHGCVTFETSEFRYDLIHVKIGDALIEYDPAFELMANATEFLTYMKKHFGEPFSSRGAMSTVLGEHPSAFNFWLEENTVQINVEYTSVINKFFIGRPVQ